MSSLSDEPEHIKRIRATHEKYKRREAKPLRWRRGLPLGDKGELTEDVIIEWQGDWMESGAYCFGRKGDHPVMDRVSWSRHLPLSDILGLVENPQGGEG